MVKVQIEHAQRKRSFTDACRVLQALLRDAELGLDPDESLHLVFGVKQGSFSSGEDMESRVGGRGERGWGRGLAGCAGPGWE